MTSNNSHRKDNLKIELETKVTAEKLEQFPKYMKANEDRKRRNKTPLDNKHKKTEPKWDQEIKQILEIQQKLQQIKQLYQLEAQATRQQHN